MIMVALCHAVAMNGGFMNKSFKESFMNLKRKTLYMTKSEPIRIIIIISLSK